MNLQNISSEENKTDPANVALGMKISFTIPSISTAISLYILLALFYHKHLTSSTIKTFGKRMITLNLLNSCLVFINSLTNLMFPILIRTFKSDLFCKGYFSFQIANVFLSRFFTFALFWIRQHHFYKNLHFMFKCLSVFQRAFTFPLILLGTILPVAEYFLIFKHSTFRVYHRPAGVRGCEYKRQFKEIKHFTFIIYSFQTFLSVSLVALVLIPLVIKKRNKRKLKFTKTACNIEKTIPRLSASIFTTCLCNIAFIMVTVLVQRSQIEVYIDKTFLVSLVLNLDMIVNSVSLQFSFSDYKRRLFFQRKLDSFLNSGMASKTNTPLEIPSVAKSVLIYKTTKM